MAKKRKNKVNLLPVMPSPYDSLGSWTGIYMAGIYELPEQDADDLWLKAMLLNTAINKNYV